MKTEQSRIEAIRSELKLLEKQIEFLKNGRSDEQQMIDWLVLNMQYTARMADDAQNSLGRPSYAVVTRNMSSHLSNTIRSLEHWQRDGLLPASNI